MTVWHWIHLHPQMKVYIAAYAVALFICALSLIHRRTRLYGLRRTPFGDGAGPDDRAP